MGAKKALSYIKKIDPYGLLFLEPGTKQAFAPMMEVREALIEANYNIHFPCASNASCPMAQSESDWCHQYVYVQQESSVARIGQMAKKNRNLLPIIIHAYAKSNLKIQKNRVVRYLRQTKHSFEWQLCVADNGETVIDTGEQQNKLINVELPKRGMSKKEVKELEQVYAGDSLNYQIVRELDEGKIRISLN